MKFLSGLCTFLGLAVLASASLAQKRFERPVVKVSDPQAYTFVRNDEVEYPSLTKEGLSVSSLVFRGTMFYYVEVVIKNDTSEDIVVPVGAITFEKTGYTVVQVDPQQACVRGEDRILECAAHLRQVRESRRSMELHEPMSPRGRGRIHARSPAGSMCQNRVLRHSGWEPSRQITPSMM